MFSVMNASKNPVFIHAHTSSLLTDGFNTQWCEALNMKADYFAMIHADIAADKGWLDIFMKELHDKKLDMISSVIAIKDKTGDSSTALLQEDQTVKRLSLAQCHALPTTFRDAKELGLEGKLLCNTGLWVIKLGPWAKEFNGFSMVSQIVCKDGQYETMASPEDWDFSIWCHDKGLKIAATTIVPVKHFGSSAWTN